MKRPLTDEDLHERASIDGRVVFAMTAFAAGSGLVALLDRVGVPERIVGVLGPVLAVAGLALIGVLMHAVKISRFYAAGRAVPAPYAGLALVALTIGFVLPFLPPVPGGAPLGGLAIGLAAGFAIAALITGPLLRKTGAFSLPDLIASRFPNLGVRLGVAAVVGGASFAIGVAGFEGAVRTFEVALGTGRGMAAFLTGLIILFMIIPGGMSGVVWGATGAAGIFIAGLGLPLAILIAGGETLPSPVFADASAWKAATTLIEGWHGSDAGSGGFMLVVAVALGIGAMAPLLSTAVTAHDTGAARKAGLSSLAWSAIAMAIIGIGLAAAALVTEQWLTGERPDRLPDFAYTASAGELLRICGKIAGTPEAALGACKDVTGFAGLVLRTRDYTPSGLWLVLSLPELREFGVAFSGLASAAMIAIALVLAGAGFQSFGTALGHDALYRVRDSGALTSRRLAMTRIIMATGVIGTGFLLSQHSVDPRKLIGIAIVLSTAAIAPLLALALWPRASGTDAAVALLCGLAVAGLAVAIGGRAPDVQTLANAAVIACAVAFIAGVATSFMHSSGIATQGSTFVHGVLHGDTDVLHNDKGA